jgi:hypothetical protein
MSLPQMAAANQTAASRKWVSLPHKLKVRRGDGVICVYLDIEMECEYILRKAQYRTPLQTSPRQRGEA